MDFLTFVAIASITLCLSMLLFLVPKYGQYISGFLNYVIPIIFGITIASNSSLGLTPLFQISSPTSFKALGILNILVQFS